MIKTIQSKDIYEVVSNISGLSDLIDLYSSEPTPKDTTYGWISILSQNQQTNSNKGYQIKEARFSITIVNNHKDKMSLDEEESIDSIINLITQNIVDEGCSKINSRGDITSLYCIESNITPLFFTQGNRSYKIKDFIIGYECNE